jgi:hypothetical protein
LKKKKHKKIGECIYCGRKARLTDDHIPPKNIFPNPRPSNLITVPACKSCNLSASKDDEYLRLMMVIREDVYEQPGAAEVWKTAYRGLKRSNSIGLTKHFLSLIKRVPTYTQAGLYLGHQVACYVDLSRLDTVVARIIKGLFYHHVGRRLPDTHTSKSFAVDSLMDQDFRKDPTIRKPIEALSTQPAYTIGNGIFSYKYYLLDDDPDSSIWLISFYLKVFFIGFTHNINSS